MSMDSPVFEFEEQENENVEIDFVNPSSEKCSSDARHSIASSRRGNMVQKKRPVFPPLPSSPGLGDVINEVDVYEYDNQSDSSSIRNFEPQIEEPLIQSISRTSLAAAGGRPRTIFYAEDNDSLENFPNHVAQNAKGNAFSIITAEPMSDSADTDSAMDVDEETLRTRRVTQAEIMNIIDDLHDSNVAPSSSCDGALIEIEQDAAAFINNDNDNNNNNDNLNTNSHENMNRDDNSNHSNNDYGTNHSENNYNIDNAINCEDDNHTDTTHTIDNSNDDRCNNTNNNDSNNSDKKDSNDYDINNNNSDNMNNDNINNGENNDNNDNDNNDTIDDDTDNANDNDTDNDGANSSENSPSKSSLGRGLSLSYDSVSLTPLHKSPEINHFETLLEDASLEKSEEGDVSEAMSTLSKNKQSFHKKRAGKTHSEIPKTIKSPNSNRPTSSATSGHRRGHRRGLSADMSKLLKETHDLSHTRGMSNSHDTQNLKAATLHDRGFRVDLGKSDPFGKLRVLYSFVPRYLLRRLRKHPERLQNIEEDKFLAVISVIDISGFTALSSRLAAQGNDGIEELKRHLNAYFGDLILRIHQFGGDIVAFAGDALIAMWVVDEKEGSEISQHLYIENMKKAAFASTMCSLEIQRDYGEYDSNPAEQDREKKDILTVHIASGFGTCTGMHVGGFGGAWFWQVTGRPFEQIARIDASSKSGDVIVSDEMWIVFNEANVTGIKIDKVGAYKITECTANYGMVPTRSFAPNSEMEQGMVSYINPSVLHTAMKHMAERVGETRPSTVLFISCKTTNTVKTLQTYVSIVQAVTHQYDGIINKLLVDEKGTTLIVVFGLPPAGAHVDDPARACLTAVAIKSRFKEQKLDTSIGIATGRIFCGVYGKKDNRMEYAILGATVNLSARLMCYTQKDILCDQVTYERAKEVMEFERWPPISLKGITDPVPVFRPVKKILAAPNKDITSIVAPGQAHFASKGTAEKCVGREPEKKVIKDAINGLINKDDNRCNVVCIEGDAGIGKSCLAYDIVQVCDALDVPNTFCVTDSGNQRPFSAYSALLKKIFGFLSYNGSQEWPYDMGQKIVGYLTENLPDCVDMASIFNTILGRSYAESNEPTLFIEESTVVKEMDKVQKDDVSMWLVIEVIRSHIGDSHVFILDDVHWLDHCSWMTTRLLCEVPNILVILCTRPTEVSALPVYEQFISSPRTAMLTLKPMNQSEILELCGFYLNMPTEKFSEEFLNLVRVKSLSHPQFAKELVLQMFTKNLLELNNKTGKILITDPSQLEMKGMEGVITSRLDMLDRQEQLTVKVASCIGTVFNINLLLYVLQTIAGNEDTSESQLKEYLNVIVRNLAVTYNEEKDEYRFKDDILKHVAYNLLLKEHRQEIHRAIAERLEMIYAHDLVPHFPVIAEHLVKDSQYPRAIHYFSMASQEDLKKGNYKNVIEYMIEAFKIDQEYLENKHRAYYGKWEYFLGQAYLGLGQFKIAIDHVKRSIGNGDNVPKTSAALKIGLVGRRFIEQKQKSNMSDIDAAIKSLGYKVKMPDLIKTPKELERELEGNGKLQRKYQMCSSFESLARIHYWNGDGRQMAMNSHHAVDTALALEMSQVHLLSFSWLGFAIGAVKGKHHKQRIYHEMVLRLSQYIDSPDVGRVFMIHFFYLCFVGHLEEAIDASTTASQLLMESGDYIGQCDNLFVRSQIMMMKGQINSILTYSNLLADLSTKCQYSRAIVFQKIINSGVKFSEGKFVESLDLAEQGLVASRVKNTDPKHPDYHVLSDKLILICYKAIAKLKLKNYKFIEDFNDAFQTLERLDQPVVPGLAEALYIMTVVSVEAAEAENKNGNKAEQQLLSRKTEKILEFFKTFVTDRCLLGGPYYNLACGFFERSRRKYRPALNYLNNGMNLAINLGLPFLEGLFYLELAITYTLDSSNQDPDGTMQKNCSKEAYRLFTEHGLHFYTSLAAEAVSKCN